jgi:hypothetical protein
MLSEALRRQGDDAGADRHAKMAADVLEEIRQEAGSEGPLSRADLKPIVTASSDATD